MQLCHPISPHLIFGSRRFQEKFQLWQLKKDGVLVFPQLLEPTIFGVDLWLFLFLLISVAPRKNDEFPAVMKPAFLLCTSYQRKTCTKSEWKEK